MYILQENIDATTVQLITQSSDSDHFVRKLLIQQPLNWTHKVAALGIVLDNSFAKIKDVKIIKMWDRLLQYRYGRAC